MEWNVLFFAIERFYSQLAFAVQLQSSGWHSTTTTYENGTNDDPTSGIPSLSSQGSQTTVRALSGLSSGSFNYPTTPPPSCSLRSHLVQHELPDS